MSFFNKVKIHFSSVCLKVFIYSFKCSKSYILWLIKPFLAILRLGAQGVYFWSVPLKWQKRSQRGKICPGQELRGSMGTRDEAMQAAQVSRRTSAVLREGSL